MIKYFPIKPEQYKMKADIQPILGPITDKDDKFDTYQAQRKWVYGYLESYAHNLAHKKLSVSGYLPWLTNHQEDLVVMDATGKMVFLAVDFPSGWDPYTLIGKTWAEVHAPVPGFNNEKLGSAMIQAQLTREFERWVWTVCADSHLDHRPGAPRMSWNNAERLYLRFERQINIPLDGKGALFLIRTYIHSLSELSNEQLNVLKTALELMPEEISKYKNIDTKRALSLIKEFKQ